LTAPRAAITIVVATDATYAGGTMTMAEGQVPQVGQAAPDFTLSATTGGTITLSQYRGEKIVVLAFYVLDWTGG
jgi:peroxiredoxin Q/BCP